MVRAPTSKSRLAAQIGLVLILLGLVSDAWLRPPFPRIGLPILGAMAILLMYVAKQIRERDGKIVPTAVVEKGAPIAIAEVCLGLMVGVGVLVVFALETLGASQHTVQLAALVALLAFAVAARGYSLTQKRFEALMKAAAH